MANPARAPKIIEMPLKRHHDAMDSFVPANFPSESPAAIAARKLEALAHFHLATEEYEEALEAFRRLLRLVPMRPDLLVQTVAIMERLERWEEGAALLAPEVSAHPDWTEAALALGICRLHLNQPAEALEVFQNVDQRLPGNSVAKEGIRAAQALLGADSGPARPEDWEYQLHELAETGDWERMIQSASAYQSEEEPTAHFYLGYALEQVGKRDLARASYEKALEGNPSHREARFNLSNLLIEEERFSEAAVQLDYLTSIDSSNRRAWWNFLLASERAYLHTNACRAAEALIEIDGPSPELLFRKGYNSLESGRFEDAVHAFEGCLEQNPHWIEARINLGLAMEQLQNFDQARAILETALREQPLSMEAAAALLSLDLAQGRIEDAVAVADGLHERGLLPPAMAYNVARAFEERGIGNVALHYYERALRNDPAFLPALLGLVSLLERRGQHDRASRARQLALLMHPELALDYFS
jgi:tetratricopeptide (TPR) repeat protein